ncbi:MAG: hypothetical protein K2X50_01375 [Gammaproteobacteria bacterium]|nr:hypothetical protein [Gammaproteobacteria bacterium]
MKSLLIASFSGLLALALTGCGGGSYSSSTSYNGYNGYGEVTQGIFYNPNYDQYTRAETYPSISGGSYYTYGGRYLGGGYGYGAPFNH